MGGRTRFAAFGCAAIPTTDASGGARRSHRRDFLRREDAGRPLAASLEQVSQMVVQEPARRVQTAPDRLEVVKARVEPRHVFCAVEMQLAPMRPRAVLPKYRIDVS